MRGLHPEAAAHVKTANENQPGLERQRAPERMERARPAADELRRLKRTKWRSANGSREPKRWDLARIDALYESVEIVVEN